MFRYQAQVLLICRVKWKVNHFIARDAQQGIREKFIGILLDDIWAEVNRHFHTRYFLQTSLRVKHNSNLNLVYLYSSYQPIILINLSHRSPSLNHTSTQPYHRQLPRHKFPPVQLHLFNYLNRTLQLASIQHFAVRLLDTSDAVNATLCLHIIEYGAVLFIFVFDTDDGLYLLMTG